MYFVHVAQQLKLKGLYLFVCILDFEYKFKMIYEIVCVCVCNTTMVIAYKNRSQEAINVLWLNLGVARIPG